MVDDLIYMLSETGWLIYDTATDNTALPRRALDDVVQLQDLPRRQQTLDVYFRLAWALFDLRPVLCTTWTNGKSTDPVVDVGAFNRGDEMFGATVEYRNIDVPLMASFFVPG